MIVKVDPGDGGVTLEEPEDCRRFHVEATGGDVAAVACAVGSSAPAPDDHVWVAIDWIRRQAAGRVGEGWDDELEAMVGFARSKGWLDDAGTRSRPTSSGASGCAAAARHGGAPGVALPAATRSGQRRRARVSAAEVAGVELLDIDGPQHDVDRGPQRLAERPEQQRHADGGEQGGAQQR